MAALRGAHPESAPPGPSASQAPPPAVPIPGAEPRPVVPPVADAGAAACWQPTAAALAAAPPRPAEPWDIAGRPAQPPQSLADAVRLVETGLYVPPSLVPGHGLPETGAKHPAEEQPPAAVVAAAAAACGAMPMPELPFADAAAAPSKLESEPGEAAMNLAGVAPAPLRVSDQVSSLQERPCRCAPHLDKQKRPMLQCACCNADTAVCARAVARAWRCRRR